MYDHGDTADPLACLPGLQTLLPGQADGGSTGALSPLQASVPTGGQFLPKATWVSQCPASDWTTDPNTPGQGELFSRAGPSAIAAQSPARPLAALFFSQFLPVSLKLLSGYSSPPLTVPLSHCKSRSSKSVVLLVAVTPVPGTIAGPLEKLRKYLLNMRASSICLPLQTHPALLTGSAYAWISDSWAIQ